MTQPAETNDYCSTPAIRRSRVKKAVYRWWTGNPLDAYEWMDRELRRIGRSLLDGLPDDKQEFFVSRLEYAAIGPFNRLREESRKCGDRK